MRRGYVPVVVAVAGWLGLAGSLRAGDAPVTCSTCHALQSAQLAKSIHKGIRCGECHQGPESYTIAATDLQRYTAPVAPGASKPPFDHGPSFAGKPQRAKIPELCGDCHANIERMNPYGIRTDQLARYWTSGHGKTLKSKGDDRVAVCIDCHTAHEVLSGKEPESRTNPLHVPATCGTCHADAKLMAEFKLPAEVVDEYRQSVHGRLLLEQGDAGAPTCATCHGNHSAVPPGFATVGAVCGQCHRHASEDFATSIHAAQPGFKGCIQCHGGGEGRHYHRIEKITKPTGVMLARYTNLLRSGPKPTASEVAETIHPDPKQLINQVLPTCTECHEELGEDKSLPKLFGLLDTITDAERYYVQTAHHLDQVGHGVLLVDNQQFEFEEAKTHLIALAPLQHTLNNAKVEAKVTELKKVCDRVNAELTDLEVGLHWRYRALVPIWGFAILFAVALYMKYKALHAVFVKPLSGPSPKG